MLIKARVWKIKLILHRKVDSGSSKSSGEYTINFKTAKDHIVRVCNIIPGKK